MCCVCVWGETECLPLENHHKTVFLNRQQGISFGHIYTIINQLPHYYCGKLYKVLF